MENEDPSYKTKICRNWRMHDTQICKFAHSESERRQTSKICWNDARGDCRYGQACRFVHHEVAAPQGPPAPPPGPPASPPGTPGPPPGPSAPPSGPPVPLPGPPAPPPGPAEPDYDPHLEELARFMAELVMDKE